MLGRASVLPMASMSPPKFRRVWIEPPALRHRQAFLREHRIVLITALPGSGKSQFMAQLASEARAALDITAWLRCSVFKGDELATAIVTTLVRSVIGERSATAALLMSPETLPQSLILSICLNEIAAFSGQVCLFLDDIGAVRGDKSWATIQKLIDEAPGNLRIVMASRVAMRLKLARLDIDGALLTLQTSDLQIGADQVADLIAGFGQPQPELAELRTLFEETRGWVGGLRLLNRKDFGRLERGRVRSGPLPIRWPMRRIRCPAIPSLLPQLLHSQLAPPLLRIS